MLVIAFLATYSQNRHKKFLIRGDSLSLNVKIKTYRHAFTVGLNITQNYERGYVEQLRYHL